MEPSPPYRPSWKLCAIRVVIIAVVLGLWFWTQSLLGQRNAPEGTIGDALLELTAPLNQWCHDHPRATNVLLILSSAGIDAMGLFLIGWSIVGRSIRPLLGLMILFFLRQVCQGINTLPLPPGKIWHDPGFPALLVTYGVSGDLFFSGHTGIAVLGAVELGRLSRRIGLAIGICIALFEIATVIILRAHYTMDVFTGALAALFVAHIAWHLAPPCDRAIARLAGQVT